MVEWEDVGDYKWEIFAAIALAVGSYGFTEYMKTIPNITPAEISVVDSFLLLVNVIFDFMTYSTKRLIRAFQGGGLARIKGSGIATSLLRRRSAHLKEIISDLNLRGRYIVMKQRKYELYQEIVDITEMLSDLGSDFCLKAVASLELSDMERDYGRAYLQSNERACEKGIPVQRVYIVDANGIEEHRISEMLNEFPNLKSRTKYLKREEAGSQRDADFALFHERANEANAVVVIQFGDRYELSIQPADVKWAHSTFNKLWSKAHELPQGVHRGGTKEQ